jgi:hypothetical protein
MSASLDYDPGNPLLEWRCPRWPACKKEIIAVSEAGLRVLSEQHMDQHYREDRDKRQDTEDTSSIESDKDYSVLNITAQDVGFLRTRHIKIDDDMEVSWSSNRSQSKS